MFVPLNCALHVLLQAAMEAAVAEFGGIDVLVNNASAIDNSSFLRLKEKKYDLMHSINARGTHLVTKHAMPHLLKSDNAQVLNISPPLDFDPVRGCVMRSAELLALLSVNMRGLGNVAGVVPDVRGWIHHREVQHVFVSMWAGRGVPRRRC